LGSPDESYGLAQDLVATDEDGGLPDFEKYGAFLGTQRMGGKRASRESASSILSPRHLFSFAAASAVGAANEAFPV
jgi:hypothetical protein